MSDPTNSTKPAGFTAFQRDSSFHDHEFTYMGQGELGGKAKGLSEIRTQLEKSTSKIYPAELKFSIPPFTVITTSFFTRFMEMNRLTDITAGDLSDERLAHHFLKTELPPDLIGNLHAFIRTINTPLAIRSSSLLEDSLNSPFAGVYRTKMIPNNQSDIPTRFNKLIEAIKFIYASTFFQNARNYMKATRNKIETEKMAVIIQKVVGEKYDKRYYPHISGVARSYNFYPFGDTQPQDGIVHLALGLGKTIVDGGISWSYSTRYPAIGPPFNSINDLMDQTQKNFWCVNLGKPPAYDPIRETEYLTSSTLKDAEYDNTIKYLASTYDAQSDRIYPGTSSSGPRIINFAPLLELEQFKLNLAVETVMHMCEDHFESPVEIEFAMTLPKKSSGQAYFGLLQVRPIRISHERVQIDPERSQNELIRSNNVLGNGILSSIRDIVFLIPEKFDFKHSRKMAGELEQFNRGLLEQNRPYLLVVFGRLGSSDPWLGIPVEWGQVSGVSAIVEATLSTRNVDLSQGSHFFHNISNLKILYFSMNQAETNSFDWNWLDTRKIIQQTEFVKHVRLDSPLTVKADGRKRSGVIVK